MPNHAHPSTPVAVIGLGCWYPGAPDPRSLWENVLARRREFRRLPDVRLPVADYHDADPGAADKTYGRRAAVIDGFDFDWARFRIPHATVEATDIAQWLALTVAERALADAGLTRDNVPRERSGVILGNTLTGEQTRATAMRTRWPFVERALRSAADAVGLDDEARTLLARAMAAAYTSAFAPVTEDTLAGGLSNTIAGRICNHFDLHGGGYTVDGACSSSLLAVCTAASRLADGDLDLALAGGVDVSLDTFELIGFAKTGALTRELMRVYDRRASGFIPGEGCAFVVLRRLDDAVAAGDRIYAVLRGWGIASDGRGGLTAPSPSGQAAALRRAYARAGVDMRTLAFIEGHGTGTRVGDRVELEGIARALEVDGPAAPRSLGVTSLKSLIGHTKAAAGIGAFLKAVIAVNRRVLPPTAGCDEPNPVFDEARALYPILHGESRSPDDTLRAGVSAMGFGGIDTHVALESAGAPAPELAPAIVEATLLAADQDAELLLLTAPSIDALVDRLEALAADVELASDGDLTDLAADLAAAIDLAAPLRAAIVGDDPEPLAARLRALATELRATPPRPGARHVAPTRDAWVAAAPFTPRIGFLFPGQGAQQLGMAAVPLARFAWARELAALADARARAHRSPDLLARLTRQSERAADAAELERWRQELAATEYAQPAITLTSAIYTRWLAALGVAPTLVGGHSLGELSAFHAAGALTDAELFDLAALRGRAMAAPPERAGAMSSLACDEARAAALIAGVDGYVVIANLNGPRQTVVSGEAAAVAQVEARAAAGGVLFRRLAASNAFHSRLIDGVAAAIAGADHLPTQIPSPLRARLFSARGGEALGPGAPLRDYFAAQALARVDFRALVQRIHRECDLLIEVGPGRALTGLVAEIVGPEGPLCLPVQSRPRGARDLLTALAAAFCHGAPLRAAALFEGRLVRPFRPARARRFIDNPCERPLVIPDALRVPAAGAAALADRLGVPAPALADYLRRRAGFLGAIVRADIADMPAVPAAPATTGASNLPLGTSSQEPAAAAPPAPSDHLSERTSSAQPPSPPAEAAPLATVDLLIDMATAQTGFPRAHITPAARLLDDLNLDSIKAAALVAAAAQRLGVAGRVDPLALANARLAEVAERLDALRGPALASAAEPIDEPPSWVRSFVIDRREEPPPPAVDLTGARVRLLADPHDPLADALATALLERGATLLPVDTVDTSLVPHQTTVPPATAHAAAAPPRDATFTARPALAPTHVIALLPVADERLGDPERLRRVALRLAAAADLTRPEAGPAPRLALVQRGDGLFGAGAAGLAPPLEAAALGFAATLHLERPAALVRLVDLDLALALADAAAAVLTELGGDAPFTAAAWDRARVRRTRTARLAPLGGGRPRALDLGADPLALVTGGARGITAECALALIGAGVRRFALVGSSPEDPAILATLARFADAGALARYYRCDIARADQVADLVARVRADLGPIDLVLHGAGQNRPRRLDHPDVDDALAEVAAKVLGARHLARELAAAPPRLFAAMTSVIGVTGMPGNAWYALANAALDLTLRRFAAEHPRTAIASLAFSVWRDVGMGVKLGSVDALARLGVAAIPTGEGVRRFVDALVRDHGDPQVVVTARIAGLDTFPPAPPAPPVRGRFIDQVVRATPGVEWVGRADLTLDTDPYLRDHFYRGSHLFPTVFGLEAMAEAVAAALPGPHEIIAIESIRLERPIVVSAAAPTRIELRVEIGEPEADGRRRARAAIGVDATGYAIDHFAATLVLGTPVSGDILPDAALGEPLDLDPRRDLYGPVLFQGPLFQRLRSVHHLDDRRLRALADPAESDLQDLAFAPALRRGPLALGDPFLRDVLLHSVQPLIPRYSCLPLEIAAIERFAGAAPGPRVIDTHLLAREGDDFLTEVTATDLQGRLCERIRGYRLRILHEEPEAPAAEELVAPGERDDRRLAAALARAAQVLGLALPVVALAHEPGLRRLARAARHERARPLVLRAFERWRAASETAPAEPADARPLAWHHDPEGRPRVDHPADLDLSISHDDDAIVCSFGHGPQGIDLAAEEPRDPAAWRALLGDPREALRSALIAAGDPPDRAGARVWAAAEAALKALGAGAHELTLTQRRGDLVLLRAATPAGACAVLTLPIHLTRGGPRLLALVVPDPAATPASRATTSPASSTAPPDLLRLRLPDGRVEERRRLVASFEDANALAGRVGLARVARWMGRARELAFGPVAHHLVADLAAGRFGLVTNDTRITLQGPATALDRIESRLWLDSFADPGGEIGFAFVRIADDGSEHPVAVGRQRFTWVRITGHGAVAAEPMPPALRAFFEELRAGADAPRPALALPVDDRGPLLVADVARPVAAERFATTREQSNLVGNIYWANYFTWASAALDALVHAHAAAPGLGEATITALAIEHTREAMPHDRVRVTLVARALHLRGATFDVHFFREAARGEPLARLAAGRMEVLWSAQGPQGPAAAPWPEELRRHLAAPPDLQDTAS